MADLVPIFILHDLCRIVVQPPFDLPISINMGHIGEEVGTEVAYYTFENIDLVSLVIFLSIEHIRDLVLNWKYNQKLNDFIIRDKWH